MSYAKHDMLLCQEGPVQTLTAELRPEHVLQLEWEYGSCHFA